MKIGLLLPGSSTHPLLPHNLVGGINAALSTYQLTDQFEFFTAFIGFGTDENLISKEANELFMMKQIDVLIVFADEPKIQKLYPLANALKKQLIIVNHGAQFNALNNGDYVAYHTLNGVLSSYLTGNEAKKNYEKALIVSSFYDGGYSIMQSMVDGFLTSEEELIGNFILKHVLKEFDTSVLKQSLIADKNPLLCALSGDLVEAFFNQMNDLEGAETVKIFASSVLVEETSLFDSQINFPITGYTCWHPNIETTENAKLTAAFEAANGRAANAVAALGWDTALILMHIKNSQQKGNACFAGLNIEAAKGKLTFDTHTNRFISSQYLVNYEPGGKFQYSDSLNDAEILSAWENIINKHPDGADAGWVNTYLCS
nr:hypothetical protein [Pedobacter sp. ASV2]